MGMRPVTADCLPVIGRDPKRDNLFYAAGHAMLGVTMGPVTAKAIADLICSGSISFDIGAFDPARFATSNS